jgi:hypothetical protein
MHLDGSACAADEVNWSARAPEANRMAAARRAAVVTELMLNAFA